jgi:transposase InsO family protein
MSPSSFDDGDNFLFREKARAVRMACLPAFRVLALLRALALALGLGDPTGDHGGVRAGFQCISVPGQLGVAGGDGRSIGCGRGEAPTVAWSTSLATVQRSTPLLAEAARFARHAPGGRWFVDETYVKVNGFWRYVYRAIDQHGQVIDVLVSTRRNAAATPPVLHPSAAHTQGDPERSRHRRRAGLSRRTE